MRNTGYKFFFNSSATLLLIASAAKLYSATGTASILTASDPLLQLTYRPIMIGVGIIEATIALYLLAGRNVAAQSCLLFWLSCNFMLYRFTNGYLHIKLCPCLGTLGSALPLSKNTVDLSLLGIVLYLFFGSSFILWSLWNCQVIESEALPPTEGIERKFQSM